MADTSRTKSEVMALLADNLTGAISPQDVRDAIESLFSPNGATYRANTFIFARRDTPDAALTPEITLVPDAYNRLPLNPALATADASPASFVLGNTDWVDPSAYNADLYDGPVGANEGLMLPPGVYHYTWSLTHTGDTFNFDGSLYVLMDPVLDPLANGLDTSTFLGAYAVHLDYTNTYVPQPANPSSQTLTGLGTFITDLEWPWHLFYFKTGSESVTVQRYYLALTKVA